MTDIERIEAAVEALGVVEKELRLALQSFNQVRGIGTKLESMNLHEIKRYAKDIRRIRWDPPAEKGDVACPEVDPGGTTQTS